MIRIVIVATLLLTLSCIPSSNGACSFDPVEGPKCDTYVQWNNDEEYSWANDCDFTGHDSTSFDDPYNSCGAQCYSSETCTHFTWVDGSCYLKRNPRKKAEEPSENTGAVCGYIPSRTDFYRVGK